MKETPRALCVGVGGVCVWRGGHHYSTKGGHCMVEYRGPSTVAAQFVWQEQAT